MKNKGLWLLLGYTLFTLGITAIVLELVGVHWVILAWLESAGRLIAFGGKLLMIIAGVLIIVFARTDWEREMRNDE
ncbi:MAG: hypothetical protein ACKO4W_06125 [Bacteroidota bacterium]|jgi:hypothetical protein